MQTREECHNRMSQELPTKEWHGRYQKEKVTYKKNSVFVGSRLKINLLILFIKMSFTQVCGTLPKDLIDVLRETPNVIIRDQCEIIIVELVESPDGMDVFSQFLQYEKEIDPLLHVDFGAPLSPYVVPHIQVEVWNILSSFQPLDVDSFRPGAPLIQHIPAQFPVLGGYQYHHAKIALQCVQQEIQNPTHLAQFVPGLIGLPSGQVICDLTIQYANAAVVTRIRKF
jgi:hypothetical protein